MSEALSRDTLFLAAAGFSVDGKGPFYCGDCIGVEGLLSLYPAISASVDVQRIAFPRPRREVVEILDEAHQSLPVLVLARGTRPVPAAASEVNGVKFIDDPAAIRAYLSQKFGVASQL